jgi:hypothetical protein
MGLSAFERESVWIASLIILTDTILLRGWIFLASYGVINGKVEGDANPEQKGGDL